MLRAAVFDFDGTLTPNIRPVFQILELSGVKGGATNPDFFPEVGQRAEREGVNPYEAMACQILDIMAQAGYARTDENVARGAKERIFNPGVPEMLAWLKSRRVQSYLISSGLQAYLKQTTIASYFSHIYATTFRYADDGTILGADEVMTEAQKALALNEIAKQVNGQAEDFSGIVYVGDGSTDLVAMRHIKARGGSTMLVHLPSDSTEMQEAQATGLLNLRELDRQARGIADFYVLADFTSDSEAWQCLANLC